MRSELIAIGGRSGVGKTSAAAALHAMLLECRVHHAVVEGDALDLAYPQPQEHGLAERNLAAIWRNYRALGYRRLIYTNTVSVLVADILAMAMGDDPLVVRFLLTASDETARARLTGRHSGADLEDHIRRSDAAARRLDVEAPVGTHRIATDGLKPAEVAHRILQLTRWLAADRE